MERRRDVIRPPRRGLVHKDGYDALAESVGVALAVALVRQGDKARDGLRVQRVNVVTPVLEVVHRHLHRDKEPVRTCRQRRLQHGRRLAGKVAFAVVARQPHLDVRLSLQDHADMISQVDAVFPVDGLSL